VINTVEDKNKYESNGGIVIIDNSNKIQV